MSTMTIGEISKLASIPASAIRYYEKMGILPKPKRTSGQRRYNADVLPLLKAIALAKQAGFTIEEIRQLFNSQESGQTLSEVWKRFARQKLEDVDALILQAERMRQLLEAGIDCGCLGPEECILFQDIIESGSEASQ